MLLYMQTRFFELGNNYYLDMELPREFDGWKKTLMTNTVPSLGRCSDLARAPNGYPESHAALTSFPVTHVVSHRTLRVNRDSDRGGEDGFITAYAGEAQASVSFGRLFCTFNRCCETRPLTFPCLPSYFAASLYEIQWPYRCLHQLHVVK
jgi:hypothetical protein